MRQAREVAARLAAIGVEGELVMYTTTGDRRLDVPLSAIGAKGLFTAELEADLRAGRVDCCVHSLKDLPTDSAPGVAVLAVLPREDSRDALVVAPHVHAASIDELPSGAVVGTSSLRRRAQLLAQRPDLQVVELRGNVPTRLRKVAEGLVDAAILAAAGLNRLGVDDRIAALLSPPHWLAAAGQGAIAIQGRDEPGALLDLLQSLDDAGTRIAVSAERAALSALGGGCQVPIGAAAVMDDGGASHLYGLVAAVTGVRVVRSDVPLDLLDPIASGQRLAAALLAAGAGELLDRSEFPTFPPQPE